MNSRMQAQTASIINLLAGIWLVMSPFIFGRIAPFQTNEFWIGIIVAFVALVRAFNPARNVWLSWANLIAGIWLLISPFALGYVLDILFWNSMILGAIVTLDAIWNIAAGTSARSGRHARI